MTESFEPSRFVSWLLAGIPPAVLIGFVYLQGVDVPYWDQWFLVPLIDKMRDGNVEIADLWGQYSNHRILFPRLVMLALASVTDWNIRWELAANVVLAGGVFVLAVWLIRRGAARDSSLLPRELIAPAASLLVFNLNQWENWAWGMQIVMFLNAAAVLGGLGLLVCGADRPRNLVAAAFLGSVASYSFANGLLFWPLSFPLVLLPRRGRLVRGLAWAVVAVAVVAFFFSGYSASAGGVSLPVMAGELARCAAFAVVCLAVPVVSYDGKLATAVGLIACLAFAAVLLRLARSPRPDPRLVLGWLAVAGYGLGTAALAALGRWHLGLPLAMSPRYITATNFFWLALLGLAAAWRAEIPARIRIPLRLAVAATVFSLLAASIWGGALFHQQYLERSAARVALVAGTLGSNPPLLFPGNRIPPESVEILRRRRLSAFRHAVTVHTPEP